MRYHSIRCLHNFVNFIRNNFGCHFRFWAPTVLFENRKVEIENLFNNISFAKKGEYVKTISVFNKTIEINPRYAEAYIARINFYGDEDLYHTACRDFKRACELGWVKTLSRQKDVTFANEHPSFRGCGFNRRWSPITFGIMTNLS